MGILSTLTAVVQQRRPGDADYIVPHTLHTTSASLGLTDSDRPTEQNIRDHNRGLAATLVRIRADAIGTAMANAVVERFVGQGTEQVEATHPWVKLLRRPNPYRSALDIWRWASMARDLSGAADFVVQHNSLGVPIGLYELFPQFGYVQPKPSRSGGVSGWIYHRADGRSIPLEPNDVIRLRHPTAVSPFETQSMLERAAFTLDKQLYADIYERDTLKEGRFPPVVLTSDQPLTKIQADQYGTSFKNAHMTAGNVKGIPVMGSGLRPESFSMSAQDIALIESRRLSDTHLFWAFQVPQGLLSDQANRANAEAARWTFYQSTVQPETDSLAAQLTIQLEATAQAEPGALRVVSPDVVPIDAERQARIDEIQLRSGTRAINELRDRDSMDSVEGGDTPMVSSALVPLGQSDFI